jgi:hypothetical protein
MSNRTCTINGCDQSHRARGLCHYHYEWHRIRGLLPPKPPKPKLTIEQRFRSNVDTSAGPDGCWLWTGYRHPKSGYGHFQIRARQTIGAHRFSYELASGMFWPWFQHLQIDHRWTCPKHCVNPAHLRPATRKQQRENLAGAQKNSRSGILGVSWSAKNHKWCAAVSHNGNQHNVYCDTIAEAEAVVIANRNKVFTHNDRDRR